VVGGNERLVTDLRKEGFRLGVVRVAAIAERHP
jgi:hypothetical protein